MCDTIPSKIYETLRRVVNEDINNFEVIIHDANKKGEGFLGDMLFISLRDKRNHQQFNIIVKQAFTDKTIRSSLPIRNAFLNEIYFYTEIWPEFDKFQGRISAEYQFKKVPKCLAVLSESNLENLVLENLKFQNFIVHDKKIPLSKEHFELIFKEYGKLHALSFAYKSLHPEKYADIVKGIKNVYEDMLTKDFFMNSVDYIYNTCIEDLDLEINDSVKNKIKSSVQKQRFTDSMKCESKYSVITHGDCWSNNMMFKYNELGNVTDMRFIDFQLLRSASPCCDLSYSIYSGAPKEVLQNLEYYLQVYYHSLSQTIREFGCNPEDLYPWQQLKQDWKRYCNLGFTLGLMVWKVKVSYEETIKDFTDLASEDQDQLIKSDYDKDAFRKVAQDLLLHLYENDFL